MTTIALPPNALSILAAQECGQHSCECHRSLRRGSGVTHCPAHNDVHPSFTIREDTDRVLFHCQTGCSQTEVLGALRGRGLWPEGREGAISPPTKNRRTATG